MGAQESKDSIPNTPDTPHFATYAKLFTLTEDPRSPGDGRTPMIVQKNLIDPRSPTRNDDAGRTPIFSIPEPISPFVRYKMENPAFQDSPLSGYMTENPSFENQVVAGNVTDTILSEKLRDIEFGEEEIKQSTGLDTNNQDINIEVEKPRLTKRRQRKSSSRSRQSLLKTALFKPYVDEENLITNEHLVDITPTKNCKGNVDPKRTPLTSKNFVLFTNENTSSAKKFEQEYQEKGLNDLQIAKRKLTLRELSIACDKENVQF